MTIPGTDEIDESMVVVPMRYDDRVIGVIALSKLGLRQFDLADVRILSILADQAATAVESAKAIGASTALAEDLRRIADMSSALSRSLDPRQVADLIAHHVGRAFGADECGISYWDRPGDRLLTWGYWPARADAGARAVLPARRYPGDAPRPGDPGARRPSTRRIRPPTRRRWSCCGATASGPS